MTIDKQTALSQLNSVLDSYELANGELSHEDDTYFVTRMRSMIIRLSPPGSVYGKQLTGDEMVHTLSGIVRALRDDYAGDCLQSYRELINAELFSDFLAMAEHLIQEELKQPAAVLAGGVLEEHLRKLCEKHGIDLEYQAKSGEMVPMAASTINDDLARAAVYGKNEQKQVTAWQGIRNSAAHGRFAEFSDGQTRLMIDGLKVFLAKYSA